MRKSRSLFILFSLLVISSFALASNSNLNLVSSNQKEKQTRPAKTNKKSWYVSWGYNKDFWSNSDIHIVQPGLNNNFTVNDTAATDWPGWNHGIFNKNFMTPQYNIRIGHFINAAHTWGVEISFDHAKYNTTLYQNGQPVNENKVLTPQYFYYVLHNGANLLMLNMVRRKPMFDMPRAMLQLVAVGKFGIGVMLPHPENTIMGNTVDVGQKAWGNYFGWNHGWWQFGGFNLGAEAGFQLVYHHAAYLELTDKEPE